MERSCQHFKQILLQIGFGILISGSCHCFCDDVGQDLERNKQQIYAENIAVSVRGLSKIYVVE